VKMRRLPVDPPWLALPIVVGMVVASLALLNESWSMAVLWAGAAVAIVCATLGVDRWLERHRPRRPR
jgi:hypothetical protein